MAPAPASALEKKATATAHDPLSAGRPSRPFAANVVCEAIARLVDQQGTAAPQPKSPGRWRINSGAEMLTYVWGFNMGRDGWPMPIRLVLDLSAAKFESPKIPALYAHASWSIIGNWTNDQGGNDWTADLALYKPADAGEAAAMPEATMVNALLRQDHPWQASVGAYPADGGDGYELVAEDDELELNGQVYAGAGDYPLYVMRKPVCFEASVVLWGADSNTGAIAAALINPTSHLSTLKEKLMPPTPAAAPAVDLGARLTALLAQTAEAHHGLAARLFAAGKTDAEINGEVHKAELAAKDAEIAALKAAKPAAPPAPVVLAGATPPGFTGSQVEEEAAPKSLHEGMNRLFAEKPEAWAGKGSQLRAAALKKWPGLDPHNRVGK